MAIPLAAGAAGCAHEYAYLPAVPGAGNDAAVRYPIPPEAPHGEVYLTSFGFTQMDVAADRTANMLHARLVAVNNGPQAWTVDGRAQQLLVPPGQQPVSPAFLNTDAGSGPVYTVPPGAAAGVRLLLRRAAAPGPARADGILRAQLAGRRRGPADRAANAVPAFRRSRRRVRTVSTVRVRRARVRRRLVVRPRLSLRLPPGHPRVLLPSLPRAHLRAHLAWGAANGAAGWWWLARGAAVGRRLARIAARWRRHAPRGRRLAWLAGRRRSARPLKGSPSAWCR